MLAFEEVLCPWPQKATSRMSATKIILFSEPERMVLREKQHRLSGGEAFEEERIISLRDNLRFTFSTFQRALKMPMDTHLHESGYQNLMRGQSVRNRLTHPKSTESLFVSDDDLLCVEAGKSWYFSTIDVLLERASTESLFHRRFAPAPPDVVSMVAKLVETGAILRTPNGEFLVGLMKQIGRSEWFYWTVDTDPEASGGLIHAHGFSTGSEGGLAVEFFWPGIEPSELMPIRRAIGDPKRQKAMLEQHRLWMERLSNNPALRAAIESKASQRAATCPEEQPVILRQTQAKLSNLPPIAPPSGANTLNPFS